MEVIKSGNIQIWVSISGAEQTDSFANACQSIHYGKAFEDTDGLSISIVTVPKIPARLVDTGDVKGIVEYLQKLFKPISDRCSIEIFIGPNAVKGNQSG